MYCITKSLITRPALVGTPSQYTLTDQTNYTELFTEAIRLGNWKWWKLSRCKLCPDSSRRPQKGHVWCTPGMSNKKTLEGVEMKTTSQFSQEIVFELFLRTFFVALSFLEMWIKWRENCDLHILIPPLRVLSQLKSQASSIWSWRSKNLRMMFPAVWCLVISTLSGDYKKVGPNQLYIEQKKQK